MWPATKTGFALAEGAHQLDLPVGRKERGSLIRRDTDALLWPRGGGNVLPWSQYHIDHRQQTMQFTWLAVKADEEVILGGQPLSNWKASHLDLGAVDDLWGGFHRARLHALICNAQLDILYSFQPKRLAASTVAARLHQHDSQFRAMLC